MNNRGRLSSNKGFTLIEIIAVLVILGILAAVAVPKYLDLAAEARVKSAQVALAEIKGRLSSVQAKVMLKNGGIAPTSPQLYTNAIAAANGYGTLANLVNLGPDYTVTVTTGTPISINVTAVQGTALGANSVAGNFKAVGDP
ncbi:MAG: prepilin-type N-terminal cleavage/methylation domain-containing protein [Thermoleophilia bacterium]|jgi:MSHA pilin protein MshA